MDALPYYKWLWRDWRANRRVQRMSWQAKGLYRELLDEFWSEGVLPRDHALLADICGCNPEEFARFWPEIEPCWVEDEGGLLNPKMDEQRTVVDRARAKMAQGGKLGGQACNSFTRAKASEANPKPTLEVPQAQPDIAEQSRAVAEQSISRAEQSITPTATALVVAPKELKPRKSPNPLHEVFKGLIWHEWENWGNPIEPPWDGAEGKQLGMFLSRNPKLGAEGFRRLLQYRARSHGVNLAERPCKWIPGLTDYAQGPLNQFKQPEGTNGTNQRGNGKADYAQAELLKSLSADYHAAAGLAQVGAGDDVPQSGGAAGFDPSDELRADDSRTILGR